MCTTCLLTDIDVGSEEVKNAHNVFFAYPMFNVIASGFLLIQTSKRIHPRYYRRIYLTRSFIRTIPTRIIHRDVKSSNILLDKDFEAHLTDFGIAKSLCTSKSYTSTYIMGTIGYIDPEYARTSRLTEKSDVYSYGVVLLELLTGRKAVDNESNLHHLILSKTANNAVMETVDPDVTATCMDLGAVKKVFQLALLCTKRQPTDRPTMHEVTRVLGSLVPSPAPPKQSTPMNPPSTQLLPSAKVPCYMDEYANLKTPHMLNCPSMSTSDAQLFLKFGEVISQNSE